MDERRSVLCGRGGWPVDEDTAAVMEERGRLGGGALACRRALLARGKRDGLLRDEGSGS